MGKPSIQSVEQAPCDPDCTCIPCERARRPLSEDADPESYDDERARGAGAWGND